MKRMLMVLKTFVKSEMKKRKQKFILKTGFKMK